MVWRTHQVLYTMRFPKFAICHYQISLLAKLDLWWRSSRGTWFLNGNGKVPFAQITTGNVMLFYSWGMQLLYTSKQNTYPVARFPDFEQNLSCCINGSMSNECHRFGLRHFGDCRIDDILPILAIYISLCHCKFIPLLNTNVHHSQSKSTPEPWAKKPKPPLADNDWSSVIQFHKRIVWGYTQTPPQPVPCHDAMEAKSEAEMPAPKQTKQSNL